MHVRVIRTHGHGRCHTQARRNAGKRGAGRTQERARHGAQRGARRREVAPAHVELHHIRRRLAVREEPSHHGSLLELKCRPGHATTTAHNAGVSHQPCVHATHTRSGATARERHTPCRQHTSRRAHRSRLSLASAAATASLMALKAAVRAGSELRSLPLPPLLPAPAPAPKPAPLAMTTVRVRVAVGDKIHGTSPRHCVVALAALAVRVPPCNPICPAGASGSAAAS